MEINFSFPALILASGYLGFACAACLGKARLRYLFHALSQIFWVWSQQTSQEMSAQKSEGAVTHSLEGAWSGRASDVPLGLGIPRMWSMFSWKQGVWGSTVFAVKLKSSCSNRNSQMAQWQRSLLPMQETQEMQVQFLGRKDPLEKEMETHFSILAWEIPWTEEAGQLQSIESQKSQKWLSN